MTLVRSPIMMKFDSGRIVSGSKPLSRVSGSTCGRFARRGVGHGFGNRFDVRRGGAAAAADDVQPAIAGELAQQPGHRLRRFVEAAQGVGQAGVGITTDVDRRDVGKLFDVGPHLLRAQAHS